MSELEEARDAAQQLFEASLFWLKANPHGRAAYAAEMLARWPWLRPNPYQGEP